jgi:hypothetical protein
MILSSCKDFPFFWPGLEPHLFRDHRMSPWEDECEILSPYSGLCFPIEERSILKSRLCLTSMNAQAGVGSHQGGGLNCRGLFWILLFGLCPLPARGLLLLLLRSQGVGSGSLASEKCLRTGKSQSGVSRTL